MEAENHLFVEESGHPRGHVIHVHNYFILFQGVYISDAGTTQLTPNRLTLEVVRSELLGVIRVNFS